MNSEPQEGPLESNVRSTTYGKAAHSYRYVVYYINAYDVECTRLYQWWERERELKLKSRNLSNFLTVSGQNTIGRYLRCTFGYDRVSSSLHPNSTSLDNCLVSFFYRKTTSPWCFELPKSVTWLAKDELSGRPNLVWLDNWTAR